MMRFAMVGSGLFLGVIGYFLYEDMQMKRGGPSSRARHQQ